MKLQLQPWTHPIVVDLGSENIRVYLPHLKKYLHFSSYVARHRESKQIIFAGDNAKQLWGKTTQAIEVIRPIEQGVVADSDATIALFDWIFHQIQELDHSMNWLFFPQCIVLTPNSLTPIEKKVLKKVWQQLTLRPAHFVKSGYAQAAGLGIPMRDATGKLLIDMGDTKTEISIIGSDTFFYTNTLTIGGRDCTLAIQRYIRKTHGLDIGSTAAESVKYAIGSVVAITEDVNNKKKKGNPPSQGKNIIVRGRSNTTSLPTSVVITQSEIVGILIEIMNVIQDGITEAVENVTADIAGDIVTQGIYLTGAGARLGGLEEYFKQMYGTTVFLLSEPEMAGVKGAQTVANKL